MLMPPADAPPDEVGSAARTLVADDPFVTVARWLERADVPAPTVLDVDEVEEALWLDDLGGIDLDQWIASAPDALQRRYERALEFLLRFQRAGRREPPPPLIRERAFDAPLLRWELEHYVEWRLDAWLGVNPTRGQRAALDSAFDDLVAGLVEIPTRPVHRDFQSHNIMVREGELFLLDFQDALIGPIVYDAVALLRDSYVRIPPDVLLSLLDGYARALSEQDDDPRVTPESVTRWFHMQTVQRKLKDAARFVFIDRVKGNPSFLPYIPSSASYVATALEAAGEALAPLKAILAELDPEVVP
jgi:aminoglycoside/choline kinase family phosphotransferase